MAPGEFCHVQFLGEDRPALPVMRPQVCGPAERSPGWGGGLFPMYRGAQQPFSPTVVGLHGFLLGSQQPPGTATCSFRSIGSVTRVMCFPLLVVDAACGLASLYRSQVLASYLGSSIWFLFSISFSIVRTVPFAEPSRSVHANRVDLCLLSIKYSRG